MPFATDFVVSRTPVASKALQHAAKKAVNDAAAKSKSVRDLAMNVKGLFEDSNGQGWHVLAGSDFAVDLRYRKGACVLVSSKKSKIKVLLYRTTPALSPTPIADVDMEPQSEEDVQATSAKKRKTVVTWFECDMDDDIKDALLRYTQATVTKLIAEKASDIDTKLAQAVKTYVSAKYGHTWHTIVSTSRDVCCLPYHEPGTLADFMIENKFRVVLYRHHGASIDTQIDATQFANRATLTLAAMCLIVYGYFALMTTEKHERCSADVVDGALMPENCSAQDVKMAKAHVAWKTYSFMGLVTFFVVASIIRMYRRSLRQKLKHG